MQYGPFHDSQGLERLLVDPEGQAAPPDQSPFAGQFRTRHRKMKSDLRIPRVHGAIREVMQQRLAGLLRRADENLYKAKVAGRNAVVVA